jgi:hypothetical protein
MAITAAPTPDAPHLHRWGANTAHVRNALKFIKSKGAVTAEQLVEWDGKHGRRLFTSGTEEAARAFRLTEARSFLNSFRMKFEGMRVRAFIHIHADEDTGIDQAAYYSVETISQHVGMREQVLGSITTRMTSLASEVKMWKLTEAERASLLQRVAAAMAESRE